MNKVKPEAAYFMPQAGERSAAFIANIETDDQIYLSWLNYYSNGWGLTWKCFL
jgi:hypothetical protein